ncbi:MAG: hypothetical protein ACKO26_04165, partial [Planctomycetota bacterium]
MPLDRSRRARPNRGPGNIKPNLESLESRLLPSVSTTFLPDPFPNAAPKVFNRSAVVEAETATRTPSVILGQF